MIIDSSLGEIAQVPNAKQSNEANEQLATGNICFVAATFTSTWETFQDSTPKPETNFIYLIITRPIRVEVTIELCQSMGFC